MVCLPASVMAAGISRRTASCFMGFAGKWTHSSAMASAKNAVRLLTTLRHAKGASGPPRTSLRTLRPSMVSHAGLVFPLSRTFRSQARSTPGPRSTMGTSATSGYASTCTWRAPLCCFRVAGESLGFFSLSLSQVSARSRIVLPRSVFGAGCCATCFRYSASHANA